jgi:glycosyltransferase involved in cell wall biosynthesis
MARFLKKVLFRLRGRVLTVKPKGAPRGSVLVSYTLVPFFQPEVLYAHANYWTSAEITRLFVELGYEVDVIEVDNEIFIPKKNYRYFVDIHANMERLAPLLPRDCVKIFHAPAAHWLFQNTAEYTRFLDLQRRRNTTLTPRRISKPNFAIEHADLVTLFGNEFTCSTYAYAKKKLYVTPFPTTHLFDFPAAKNFETAKKQFIWFGGVGAVHKGLDLTVEAFARMPEYRLIICGKVINEPDFAAEYAKELALPNITAAGLLDPGGPEFKEIYENSLGVIFPSCSEGGGGSCIIAMHAGLIPIASYESAIDTGNFGITLKENTVQAICDAIEVLAQQTPEQLELRSRNAWKHVRANHTREKFTEYYRGVLTELEAKHNV